MNITYGQFTITLTAITSDFSRLTVKPSLSNMTFNFLNLIHQLFRTSKQNHRHTVATHIAHPLWQTPSQHLPKRKGHSTDPWCIPTMTSNSSDNSESTLNLVFAPSYILITDLTKISSIKSLLIANFNTLIGTLPAAFYRSTKHTKYFLPIAQYPYNLLQIVCRSFNFSPIFN